MSSLLSRLNMTIWLIPVSFFVASLFDQHVSVLLKMPAGIITSLLEILLSGVIAYEIGSSSLRQKSRYIFIPGFIAAGDFFYCLFNYVLKAPIPNHMGCLIYVTPYLLALVVLIIFLIKIASEAAKTEPRILGVAIFVSILVLALTTYEITIPALYHKEPPLIPLMKSLTVIYSLLESIVIGFSVSLILCATSKSIQALLFGILIMHVSDMAIRYQSVNVTLMGMNIFDNGWCMGLAIVAIAAKALNQKIGVRKLSSSWLPLRSLRGMTIAFILVGFTSLWLALTVYYHQIDNIAPVTGTLLISVGAFAFAVLVADFSTNYVTAITLNIQNAKEFKFALSSPFVPHEIKVIVGHFNKLNSEIAEEKDRVLTLTSTVTHDLRNPLTAIQSSLILLENSLSEGCDCHSSAEPYLNNLKATAGYMRKISDDLLKDRRSVLDGELLSEAIQDAKKMVELSQLKLAKKNEIVIENNAVIPGLRIDSLTRVLSNLIFNAVEASPPNRPVLVQVNQALDVLEIIVRDQGSGMSEQLLSGIHSGSGVTTKEDGNGLGLPYVISWAKRKNIRYEICSELGKGTEFTLRLNHENSVSGARSY